MGKPTEGCGHSDCDSEVVSLLLFRKILLFKLRTQSKLYLLFKKRYKPLPSMDIWNKRKLLMTL
jgi:hypothetical protein